MKSRLTHGFYGRRRTTIQSRAIPTAISSTPTQPSQSPTTNSPPNFPPCASSILRYNVDKMSEPSILGEFEQIVLLAILGLVDNAYGVTIAGRIRECTGR